MAARKGKPMLLTYKINHLSIQPFEDHVTAIITLAVELSGISPAFFRILFCSCPVVLLDHPTYIAYLYASCRARTSTYLCTLPSTCRGCGQRKDQPRLQSTKYLSDAMYKVP